MRCRGKVYINLLVIITGSPDILFITSFPPTNAYDSPFKINVIYFDRETDMTETAGHLLFCFRKSYKVF